MSNNLSLEDLVEEFLQYCKNGESPDISEFANMYPEHKEELLDILPLLRDLEDLGYKRNTQYVDIISSVPNLTGSDYQLIRKIGSGGMGIVFEALQMSLNRKVAVKLLSNSLISDKLQREQFENESKIIAMLHHPNIVKVLSAKCTSECCYYAMEFIDGKGLNHYKISDIKNIARIGLQVSKALAYAHSCKIMHRDIKPANLLLDESGQVHVSDFGLAFIVKSKNSKTGQPDAKSGTLRYMAPETLIRGENSFLSDQYSLGATLYEIITNKPFVSAKSTKELKEKICSGFVPKLSSKDNDFAAIVNKCLSFNPSDRYKNMDEVSEDIQRFLNNEEVSTKKYSAVERFKLWKKRNPGAAFWSLTSVVCAIAFFTALCAGYIQTGAALKLAQKNAATADAALSKIFSYVQKQTPSAGGSILLDALMPYYQEIAQQSNIPQKRLIEANRIVGLYAMRSGNYALAEKSYKKLAKLEHSAYSFNQLSDALEKMGKKNEAFKIRNNLIKKYSESKNPNDLLEVVRALQKFDTDHESRYKAFQIVKSLLNNEPENPEYLFQYAVLLGNNPRLFAAEKIAGVEPNAIVLLRNLASQYPDNPEYGIAIIQLITKKLHYYHGFSSNDFENLNIALKLSDQMLAKFPNTPKVVSSVVELKKAYIKLLRNNGDMAKSRKETENLTGMLELLFYNPEIPDDVRECLIDLQLDRLGLIARTRSREAAYDLSVKIKNELNLYNGRRKQEFINRYNNLTFKKIK